MADEAIDTAIDPGEIEIEISEGVGAQDSAVPDNATPEQAMDEVRRQADESAAAREASERARLDAERRIGEETRRREAAERAASEAATRADASQRAVDEAQYETVVSSLAAANTESQRLTGEKAKALADGDYQRVAELDRDIGKLSARIVNLEDGKAALDEKRAARPAADAAPPQREARAPSDLERQEDFLSKQHPVNAAWIRSHRDRFFSDSEFQRRAVAASQYALEVKKLDINSPDYLAAVEADLGLRTPAPAAAATPPHSPPAPPASPAAPRPAAPRPAAPPSRTTPSQVGGRPVARVTLTPEEVEHARLTMTPEVIGKNPDGTPRDPLKAYAAQKLALQKEGRWYGPGGR